MKKFLSIFLVFVLVFSLAPAAFAVTVGNVDGDKEGTINSKDVTALRRYLAGGYKVEIVVDAADVNGDHDINAKDITVLRRFVVGGYGVELSQPGSNTELGLNETPRIPLDF